MKKNKNLNKMTSLIVKFKTAEKKEINNLLHKLNISGVCVSNLMNRWALDVPYWKEKFYTEKLSESDLIEKIHSNPTVRNRFYKENEESNNE